MDIPGLTFSISGKLCYNIGDDTKIKDLGCEFDINLVIVCAVREASVNILDQIIDPRSYLGSEVVMDV